MKYSIRNIGAVTVFVIAFIVYLITMAPTVSFWDCGEFITCSVTMGIPHPPGAPLYLMIGKIFSTIPFGADDSYRINLISVLSSALTVLIVYLIIVRLIKEFAGEPETTGSKLAHFGGGMIVC